MYEDRGAGRSEAREGVRARLDGAIQRVAEVWKGPSRGVAKASRGLRRRQPALARLGATLQHHVLPVRQPLKREPTHPSEILREDVLPALRMKASQAARELGVSRQLLHRILAGRAPVTLEMAVRLGKWAGNGPALWLGMQQAFDVCHAEQALAAELERIPRHAA